MTQKILDVLDIHPIEKKKDHTKTCLQKKPYANEQKLIGNEWCHQDHDRSPPSSETNIHSRPRHRRENPRAQG